MYQNTQTTNVDNISAYSTVTMTDDCDDISADCCQGGLSGCARHCNAAHFAFIPVAINLTSHIIAEPKVDNFTWASNSVVLTNDNPPPIF